MAPLVLVGLGVVIAVTRLHTYDEPLERDITTYAVIAHEIRLGRALYSCDVSDDEPRAEDGDHRRWPHRPGVAWRLLELGYPAWQVVDEAAVPGGLAGSVVDAKGFTWDPGGHVVFSHYEYFDHLVDGLLGQAWVEHVRESWVWMRERFIPYPLQNNFWRLPPEDLVACLDGLLAVRGTSNAREPPRTFHDWIQCWMYFPESTVAFYRVTVFSNYSPHNVPEPGRQWSLLCEVSESPVHPVDGAKVVDDVVRGLRVAGLVPEAAAIVSRWHRRLPYGYPTPFLGRDAWLAAIDPALRRLGIWSRGRFGAWKYEVANQDHALMQGVEAVDHILFGTEETTYRFPGVVNAGKGPGRRPGAPWPGAGRAS